MVGEKAVVKVFFRFDVFLIRFANVSPYTYRKLAPI